MGATPEALARADAAMLLWGLRGMPAWLREVEVVAAVTRVVAAGETDGKAVLAEYLRWQNALSTDWATNRALTLIYDTAEQILGVAQHDVEQTAEDMVRAAGLWAWDELLSEAAELGDPDGSNHRQELERDRVELAAHEAISRILEEHLAPRG